MLEPCRPTRQQNIYKVLSLCKRGKFYSSYACIRSNLVPRVINRNTYHSYTYCFRHLLKVLEWPPWMRGHCCISLIFTVTELTDVKLFCPTTVNASEPNLVLDCWEELNLLVPFIPCDSPQCGKSLLVISRMLYGFLPIWGKSFPSYCKVSSHLPAWSSQSWSLSWLEYHSVPWTSAGRCMVLGMGDEAPVVLVTPVRGSHSWLLLLFWLLNSLYWWSDS